MSFIKLGNNFKSKTLFNGLRSFASITTQQQQQLQKKASLELENGPTLKGKSFGANKSMCGELVFSTSQVGYPESMTDPSYKGQILVFTQPLIGNYGVPGNERDEFGILKFFESEKIHVNGIIVSNYSEKYSHWNAVKSLSEWCIEHNIPALSDVDTRALTKMLRDNGSSLGRINIGHEVVPFEDPNERNLVSEVSTKNVQVFNKGGDVVIGLIDCGVKNNIIRCLAKRGAEVHLYPWDTDLSKVEYDGLFISNGPGDPTSCQITIDNLKKQIMEKDPAPIFGICMGNLLLGLSTGAQSYKLKHGNRGHNQPALNLTTGVGVITSQNHGFAIKEDTLPSDWVPYFRNINDGSNEGIRHVSKPISSVQFHPESMGGPQDSEYLFDLFLQKVRAYKAFEVKEEAIQA